MPKRIQSAYNQKYLNGSTTIYPSSGGNTLLNPIKLNKQGSNAESDSQ